MITIMSLKELMEEMDRQGWKTKAGKDLFKNQLPRVVWVEDAIDIFISIHTWAVQLREGHGDATDLIKYIEEASKRLAERAVELGLEPGLLNKSRKTQSTAVQQDGED